MGHSFLRLISKALSRVIQITFISMKRVIVSRLTPFCLIMENFETVKPK